MYFFNRNWNSIFQVEMRKDGRGSMYMFLWVRYGYQMVLSLRMLITEFVNFCVDNIVSWNGLKVFIISGEWLWGRQQSYPQSIVFQRIEDRLKKGDSLAPADSKWFIYMRLNQHQGAKWNGMERKESNMSNMRFHWRWNVERCSSPNCGQ